MRERALQEREKRLASKETTNKDIELIRRALNLANNEEWPLPKWEQQNPQHCKIATIVTLALLDEASSPGVFNKKIEEACNNNGIPIVKYKLEPNTAKNFQKSLCGAQTSNTPALNKEKKKSSTPKTSKFYNDQMRQKRNINCEENSEEENLEPSTSREKKPRIIKVNTQQNTSENTLNKLQIELEKYIIMIENEENVDKVETELRTLTIRQLSELLSDSRIINNTEWTLLLKNYIENLIQMGNENTRIKAKVQEVNMESIEISILRAAEQERSYEREKLHLEDSSESEDDDSPNMTKTNSYESIDEWIENLAKENALENKRISSYPLDYYVENGTFSD